MNSTFAIHAAVPAIPAKPKMPAMIAIIRKIIAHDSMCLTSRVCCFGLPERRIGLHGCSPYGFRCALSGTNGAGASKALPDCSRS